MRTRLLLKLSIVGIVALVSLAGLAGTLNRHDTVVPVVIGLDPALPGPNQAVQITLQMSGATSSDQPVTIGCTDPYAWSDLPQEVIVPAGESTVQWTSHTSSVYTRWAIVTATADGASALGYPGG